MTTTPTSAARVSGTIKARADLLRDALRFAYLAAGEGIEIDGLAPEDFLMAYSDATGDEEWDTFADRLAAIQPDPETKPVSATCANIARVATPSSAGTVSVEAAGWQPIETAPNELAILIAYDDGTIKAIDAEENDYNWRPYRGHRIDRITSPTHWIAQKAALRALAGEGER